MAENDQNEERVRQAFKQVKEDIESIKRELSGQKNDFLHLKTKIEELLDQKKENKPDSSFFYSSIGNEGVVNNQQQSTTIVNDSQQSSIKPSLPENHQKTQKNNGPKLDEVLRTMDVALAQKFQALTDREFSVFAAVLELEEQDQETTYTDLADRLNISESTIRGVVNRIISKGLPLEKQRFLHKKAFIGVLPGFRDLHLLKKLITLRHNPQDQTHLGQF